jgi:putative PIG3 family NAD(P)H quinone oxidoreductase
MKALRIVSGDPPRLDVVDIPNPVPGPRQVLVRVTAAGVNRADLLQLRGRYPAPPDAPADIPGLEFAGIVESLGSGCLRIAQRQRVFGLCSGGAHAQYVVSPEELLMPTPVKLNDIEAGAVPEAFITAHDALVTQAGMEAGERVLIHAIGSGVGLAALEIANAWGCDTFGTSRSQYKIQALERLRVDPGGTIGHTFACTPDSFDDEILKRTDNAGVDIILDPVGAPYFERNLRALAPRGCLVVIATMGGTTATLSLPVLMHKRLKVVGTMLRTRSLLEKAAAMRAFERDVLPKFISGELKPIIDRTYPLEQAASAYKYMEDNLNFGKVVLTS